MKEIKWTNIKAHRKVYWTINPKNDAISNEEESNWASSSSVIPTIQLKGIQPPQ
jgi:hypothetical protein